MAASFSFSCEALIEHRRVRAGAIDLLALAHGNLYMYIGSCEPQADAIDIRGKARVNSDFVFRTWAE